MYARARRLWVVPGGLYLYYGSDYAKVDAVRALVTGASGFVGGHLTDRLLAEGWEVWGCSSAASVPGRHASDAVQTIAADLEVPEQAAEAVRRSEPDVVFHLAARAAVAPSHSDPWATLRPNIGMQTHVLEAVRRHRPECAVLVVGSGEVYGLARPEDLPLNEDAPLRPASPYAVSKVAQDFLGLQYHLSYGLKTVRVRPFNHLGPGQGPGFVAADFAKQLVEAELGWREPVIEVGNLEARRDFTDVRDVVRAYVGLMQGESWGQVFNVASGTAVSIAHLLELLLHETRAHVEVSQAPARMRPSDVPEFYGDAGRLRDAIGWQPRIPLEQTLRDVMQYWRERLVREGRG